MDSIVDFNGALNTYSSIIKNKLPQPNSYDSNTYNYRTGSMGRESSNTGYRSAIFYVQLSTKIAPVNLYGFLKKTEQYIINGYNSPGIFHMFFLNDENGKLIHPKGHCTGHSNALRATNDYFNKYLASTDDYPKKLAQIFPASDLYPREKSVSKDDLCILITDEDGVTADEEVLHGIIRKANKLIHIKFLPENMYQVSRIREENFETLTDPTQN